MGTSSLRSRWKECIYIRTHIHQRFQRKSLETAKELPISGGYKHFSPSQIPKTNHLSFNAFSWNWYQTLRFLSSILKKQNFTASPQVQRQRPNESSVQRWRPSNRRRRGETLRLKHFFHGTTDTLLVAGHAMPCQVMTSSCGTRSRDLPRFQKSRPGVCQPYFL